MDRMTREEILRQKVNEYETNIATMQEELEQLREQLRLADHEASVERLQKELEETNAAMRARTDEMNKAEAMGDAKTRNQLLENASRTSSKVQQLERMIEVEKKAAAQAEGTLRTLGPIE